MRKIAILTAVMLSLLNSQIWSYGQAKPKEDKDNDKFPPGCVDTGYEKKLKVLTLLPYQTGERNSLYLVYNSLPQTVNLFQMRDGDSLYSMHLNHSIPANRWAGFSTSEPQLKFLCTVADRARGEYGKIIDCGEALKVCELTKVVFGLNNRGNLWMVKGNTRNGAMREIVRYGIIPAR